MASIIVEAKKQSRNRKEKDLFLEGTRIWNEERVKELFPTHDAEDILKPMMLIIPSSIVVVTIQVMTQGKCGSSSKNAKFQIKNVVVTM